MAQIMHSVPNFLNFLRLRTQEEILSQHLSRKKCWNFKISDFFEHTTIY